MSLRRKKVLLVYENVTEMEEAEKYLINNGYQTSKANELENAFMSAIDMIPDLIVLNLSKNVHEIESFNKKVTTSIHKKVELLNIVDLDSYLRITVNEHVAIKPVKPGLLLHLVRLIAKN